MVDKSDIENGYAHAVAPTWDQGKFLGGEVFAMSVVCLATVFVVLFGPKTFTFIVVSIIVGVVGISVVQFVNRFVDDKYFSLQMGFTDRGEYIGSSSLHEYIRDTRKGNGLW